MKRVFIVLFTLLGSIHMVVAQTLSGTVTDATGQPMPFVNVVELSQTDSAFVCGTVTKENGTFALENVKHGNILQISNIGYETQYVGYNGQATIAIQLKESAAMLGEVVVKSSLPKTILRGEGMQTTVAGTLLEKTSDMNHLLSRIPSVSAEDGDIEVFGRGTPVIYIDGRKMQDEMDLQRLQPSDIQKVEVITNPGARYAASVKCVIRITTKKKQGDGLSVDTKTTFRVNEETRLSSYETLGLNYRKGGLDLNGYLYGAYTHAQDDKLQQQFTYQSDTWQQNTAITQEYTNINPYGRLGASYLLDADNSFGASISYDRYAKCLGEGDEQVTSYKNGQLIESSTGHFDSPSRITKVSSNAYYVGKIGKLGIDFNADYYWYGNKNRMDVHETVENETSDVRSRRNSRNTMIASKLVLSYPVWQGDLSFGGEYSSVRRRMRYVVTPNVADDENEKVQESMTSAFIDYSRAFGPLQVQAGLRYEYNDFNYYANDIFMAEQSKTYGNWFPSLALSMPVGKTQMQLTYASDIYRPSYSELRSGVQYNNQYSYESGNPFLVPSISRNLTYNFSWSWLNLQLIYTHISDEICTIVSTYNDNPLTSLARPENINSYNMFQSVVSLSPTFGIWHPELELMLVKQWLRMDTHVGNRLDKPVAEFQLTNTLDFKWLTASFVITAQTEGNYANKLLRKGYFNTDLSLYKSMLKDRLTLTLDAHDLFGTGDFHSTFYSGTQRSLLYDTYTQSTVTLGIRYRFNATNSKYKGTGAGQSQKNRM